MVGVTQRPDVDWVQVETSWRAGESLAALARRHGVTRQAIQQRMQKGGWVRAAEAEQIAGTKTAQRAAKPKTATDRAMTGGNRTSANMLRLCDMLAGGSTLTIAARRLGLTRDQLRHWLDADPELRALAEQAQGEFSGRLVEAIADAGQRGDWRASLALLERHPLTKGDFAAAASQPANPAYAGPAVVLQLNLSAASTALLSQPPKIVLAAGQDSEPDGMAQSRGTVAGDTSDLAVIGP